MAKYLYIVSDKVMPDRFGVKGKNLHALWANNFRIPLTLCLTIEAYNDYIKINRIESKTEEILKHPHMAINQKSDRIADLIMSSNIPEEMYEEFAENGYLKKMNSKWAIRSSSNMEDLPGLSFAGLYESYLNIQGLEQILEMVKRCWASLWNERAIIYRGKHDLDHRKASMAVVIQEMISPRYSGVIFTRNPTDTISDEILLEYCEGLGEDLVSGKIKPYAPRIHRNALSVTQLNNEDKGGLSDELLVRLSKLALTVEECFGSPQDIEWAYDSKGFHILQTRPITRLNKPHQIALDSIWTRANIGEVLPNVITPLTWDIFRATLFHYPELVFKTSQDDQIFNDELKIINGRCYLRLKFFLDSFCYLPYVTPQVMKHVLGIDVISQASTYIQPAGIRVKVAQCLFILNVFKILPRISIMLHRLPDIPPPSISNLEKIILWNAKCFHLHIKCTAYSISAFALLSHFLYKWLPSEAKELLSFILTGKENLQTAKQGISLWEITNFVRKRHELEDIIKKDIEWTKLLDELNKTEDGTKFLIMFEQFLNTNGIRAAGEFELAVPRWKEDPSFVINTVKKYLNTPDNESYQQDASARKKQRQKVVDHIKSSLRKTQRFIFSQMLVSYADYCTLRENIKYRLMEGYYVIRSIFLEIEAQLISDGILENKNDIFFLRPSEVISFLSGKQPFNEIRELIVNRKTQHVKWESRYAPELVFQNGIQVQTSENGNNLLKGIGCSSGIVEGCARVLKDISEMKFLQPGEILVTPHTDPGWTPLFLSCKGIVTEIGGFLSHGATVAREYGIPAVVNVKEATTQIHTGDYIQLNGELGHVTIIKCNNQMQ